MAYIGTEPKDVRSFGRAKFDYTATQGQTAFTGADDDGKTLGFTDGQMEVFVNGILMDESDFSTSNGNTVTLASAANLNDIISIVAMQTDIPNSDYVPASGGTFSGNITVGGTTTLSDDLVVDTDTLFVDASANKVGIGTTTPDYILTLEDTSHPRVRINSTDNSASGIFMHVSNGGSQTGSSTVRVDGSGNYSIYNGTSSEALNMNIDGSGRVTTPNQPAFAVYKTATTGSGSTITHNGSWSNVGNHYSSSTGRFTCPVAGTYFFYCTGLTQPNGNVSRLTLALNGSNRASQSRNENISGDYLHIVTMGVMTVSAGDYVTSYYANDDGGTNLYSDTSPYITFGGYLIG